MKGMPCLIEPQTNITTNNLIAILTDAIQVLFTAASVQTFRSEQHDRHWACRWKRQKIRVEDRSSLTPGDHDFSEVLNQSANIARLIDVLEWVRNTHAAAHVRSCDPTQSNTGPVDLVAESREKLLLFEITDTGGAGFAAKMRRQARKLDTVMNTFRISSEGRTLEAFHVAGANEKVSPSRGWIRIGSADTSICPHPPVHVIDGRT
jgi:hypothetical protein